MVLNICVKFHENISNGFYVTKRTRVCDKIAIFNVQSAITPKEGKPDLGFLRSACHLILLNICVNFHENISKGFQVTERERFFGCQWQKQYVSLTLHIIYDHFII